MSTHRYPPAPALVLVRYQEPRGVHRLCRLPFPELSLLLQQLCQRRVHAEAEYEDGAWAGHVGKHEGRWSWTCERSEAQ